MRWEDVLRDAQRDKFGNMVGKALFPYFQTDIEVACEPEVTPEYASRSLAWLGELGGERMKEICRYASFYLQDQLECTSVGELLDEGVQDLKGPLDILEYMGFHTLDIENPEDPELPVLNLGGWCDWQEDEGLQCLIKDWKVLYLGTWNDCSVWQSHYLNDDQYLSNYVLYERRAELQAKAAERLKSSPPEPFPHLEIPMSSPIRKFVEFKLALTEQCSSKEAWTRLENTLLFEFMRDYPKLAEESFDFLYRCFCIERDEGGADMAGFLAEQRDYLFTDT